MINSIVAWGVAFGLWLRAPNSVNSDNFANFNSNNGNLNNNGTANSDNDRAAALIKTIVNCVRFLYRYNKSLFYAFMKKDFIKVVNKVKFFSYYK